MTLSRSWAGAALVVAMAVGLVLGAAARADAHAVLQRTEPSDGAVLDNAPSEVALHFNEPVDPGLGGLRVFGSAGERVDDGSIDTREGGAVVVTGLRDGLGDGTYVATWRVTSADGHPLSGGFVFDVGAGGTADGAGVADLLAAPEQVGMDAVAAGLRAVLYVTVLLAAGVVAFHAFVSDRRGSDVPALWRVVTVAAGVAAAATVLGVGVQGAVVTGLGVRVLADSAVAGEVLSTTYGVSAAVRLGGLVLLLVAAVACRRAGTGQSGPGAGPGLGIGLVGGVLALGSFVLDGHTASADPRWLGYTADMAHVLAGAVWFGGLAGLWLTLRRRRLDDDPVGGARLVARFSSTAGVSAVVVAAAGLALSWMEVRAPRALVASAYGWTLLAKVALVGAIVAVAAHNRRRLVPAVQRVLVPSGGAVDTAPPAAGAAVMRADAAWARLRRTVRIEALGIVVVLLVTAVLVNLVPARQAAGLSGPFSADAPLGEHRISVTVDPNRAGANELHFYLLSPTGQPVDVVEQITVELSQPSRGIAPIVRKPAVAGPGHWTMSGTELSLPGPWVMTVNARLSRFEQASARFEFVVNP